MEILQVRYPTHLDEIKKVIDAVGPRKLASRQEKTMLGKELYAPKELNAQFRAGFSTRGYAELRDTYTIAIPDSPVRIPGAFKQVDFVKDKVLVEVQFGKESSRNNVSYLDALPSMRD